MLIALRLVQLVRRATAVVLAAIGSGISLVLLTIVQALALTRAIIQDCANVV